MPTGAKLRLANDEGSVKLPRWLAELNKRDASVEEMLAAAIAQVRRRPRERSLVEAQLVVNELARSPRHAKQLRRAITGDVLRSFMLTPDQDAGT